MRKDAESHADEDKKRRELAELRNKASNFVYQTEKTLKEHADKLDDSSKSAIETAMQKVRDAEKGDDVAALKSALEDLEQATHALSKHIYEASAQAGATGAAGDGDAKASSSDDDVIDAEFETKS